MPFFFSSISSCLNALSITVLEDLIKPTLDYCDVTLSQKFEARLAKVLGKYVKNCKRRKRRIATVLA